MTIKKRKKTSKGVEYIESSGNVFADLDISNPEEALAKADVTIEICEIIKRKKLTNTQAAKMLNIDQSQLSLLLCGCLKDFSLEKLLLFLNDLGQDV